jgi:hypothetical protein
MGSIRSSMVLALVALGCAGSPATPRVQENAQLAALAEAREQQLDRLHEYRVRGEYPTDAQGRPISVFRDEQGRPCAMASLIEQSGRTDLVDQVVRDDNTLKLADVQSGPLMDWMEGSGLTQEEVALVQGALEIDYSTFQFRTLDNDVVVVEAHNEVSRRLEAAERTLRARPPYSGPGNNAVPNG